MAEAVVRGEARGETVGEVGERVGRGIWLANRIVAWELGGIVAGHAAVWDVGVIGKIL
jgi:hypothetical protein